MAARTISKAAAGRREFDGFETVLRLALAIAANEEINGHRGSNENDEGLHPGLRELLGKMRARVTAQQGACGHDNGLRPNDRAGHDESDRGDTVDDSAQNYFELVHGVNVGHAERPKHRQIHDADAAPEIAAITSAQQLKHRRAPPPPLAT